MTNSEPRFITADGKSHTGDNDWWQQTFTAYEPDGVPTELINLARPLLDGNRKEQAFAHDFLIKCQGMWHADAANLGRPTKVGSEQGYSVPPTIDPSEDDLMRA